MSSLQYINERKNLNPLTPKSDQLLISPYNITPESNIKITRIKEMTTEQPIELLIFKQIILVSNWANV